MPRLRLYHYWRSSSSWRVRWALAHKSIPCEMVAVDLLSGDAESAENLKRNPLGYVPTLEFLEPEAGGPRFLMESVAILEWLEESFPSPALLPREGVARAQVRQLVQVIAADTQPLQNLNPQYLHSDDPEKRKAWAQHWIRNGLAAYEKLCSRTAGRFSFGDELSMADLCLVPQCYNAARYEIGLADYPTIARVHAEALKLESYRASEPERFGPKGN